MRELDGKEHAARPREIVRALANFAAHNTAVDYGCAITDCKISADRSVNSCLPNSSAAS
jgi:hypothetical protein